MNFSILIVRLERVIICKVFRKMWRDSPRVDVDGDGSQSGDCYADWRVVTADLLKGGFVI
jgi:hypothetical protein